MKQLRPFFALVLLILIFGFIVTSPNTENNAVYFTPPSNNNLDDRFLFGSMNSAFDEQYSYTHYDSLKMNFWHFYQGTTEHAINGRHQPISWLANAVNSNDCLFTPVAGYSSAVVDRINDLYGDHNNSRLLLMRPKIEYLCYGQRSDYQCETVSTSDHLWFYSFQSSGCVGEDIEDEGVYGYDGLKVRYCEKNISQTDGGAGWVVNRLKANSEQSRGYLGKNSGHWQADGEGQWIIKPKIRIDSIFAANNPNVNVCKIIAINQDGDTVKNIILKTNNFSNGVTPYNGRYREDFFFGINDSTLTTYGSWGTRWLFEARGNHNPDWSTDNHSDIQVYWYGNCDMWIDRVRVDNDIADELFNGEHDDWIEDEINLIADNLNPSLLRYYIEYIEFNNIPCLSYVNRKVKDYSGGQVEVISDWYYRYGCHVPWAEKNTVINTEHVKRFFIDSVGVSQFYAEQYSFRSDVADPPLETGYSRIPNTLPVYQCSGMGACGIFVSSTNAGAYDEWLQENLSYTPHFYSSNSEYDEDELNWDRGGFTFVMKLGNQISKDKNIPFIYMPAAHSWYNPPVESQREPTNEELQMQANLAASYGARGLMYFWFQSMNSPGGTGQNTYSRSILDPPNPPDPAYLRNKNVYEQTVTTKKQTFIDIGKRMKAWESTLLAFDYDYTNSYIYYNTTERNSLLTNSYFRDVVSYKTGSGTPDCTEDNPDTTDSPAPSGMRYECKEDRYLQVATFKGQSNDYNKYFMVVNRRCSPYYNESTEDNRGGRRYMRVFVDPNHSDFAGYNNWNIIDIEYPHTIVGTFSKTTVNPFVSLGWFMPGQGRLYKIVPTVQSGGTLAANEDISNQTFTCEDTVYNGGYNITIDSNSTISFTDSATIIMSGGTFTSGIHGQNQLTTYKGVSSADWKGLRFTGSTVKIYNSKFQDIASPSVNYAVKMVNCPLGDIRTNQFVLDTDTAGAVQSVYSSAGMFTGLYISYNSVTMNNSRGNALCVQGFSGLTLPVYVMNNTMTSNGYATGVLLSTITGGAVKSNSITGFSTGVNTLFSTTDLFGNTISNTSGVSKGILVTSSGTASLLPSGSLWLAGFNTITNTSGASKNIELSGSAYALDGGSNTFDIASSTAGAFHLFGTLSSVYDTKSMGNCFKLSGTTVVSPNLPKDSVLDGTEVTFDYLDYICGGSLPEGSERVDIGGGLYDTIPGSSGEGGGKPGSLPLGKGEIQRGSLVATTPPAGTIGAFGHPSLLRRGGYVLTPAQLYDSVRINIRKQNYTAVKLYALELIEDYPGTYEAVSSLQSLYMAAAAVDTSSSGITALKTFYETLILNNGSNTALVKISYYLAQKCKVLLGDYSSAMSGFQQIINNNPYSYEGLVARWDYMATSLMAPGGGGEPDVVGDPHGGQIPSLNTNNGGFTNYEFDESDKSDKFYDPDGPFTKEQKQQIHSSVKNAFETAKNDDDRKVKTLEDKASTGDETAKHELNRLRTLKELIKSEKPRDITQHIAIVSSDLQKAFGNTAPVVNKPGIVPVEFSLSQNYPNPFNPVTTIKYALPNDVRVVIKVYDILGREVRTLVNEPQKAGYYDIKFDGSAYASGVYFYRIEAGDYVVSKKMVLVK